MAVSHVQAAAMPTLEAFEVNPNLLDRRRRRLNQDSPPPYMSPTEGENETESDLFNMPQTLNIVDTPLSEEELNKVGKMAIVHYEAGLRLFKEYMAERDHLETFSRVFLISPKLTYLLKYQVTGQRLHILARAAVRKRWQALGVWSDAWGAINCEKVPIGCKTGTVKDEGGQVWAWEWQSENSLHDKTHPAWRAALLRAGLRREEFSVP